MLMHFPKMSKRLYANTLAHEGSKVPLQPRKTQKIYLPSELNITKLYEMFNETNPNFNISYHCYRSISKTEFNISFGFPRRDTCSTCDTFIAKLSYLQSDLEASSNDSQKVKLMLEEKRIKKDHDLLKRNEVFYSLK